MPLVRTPLAGRHHGELTVAEIGGSSDWHGVRRLLNAKSHAIRRMCDEVGRLRLLLRLAPSPGLLGRRASAWAAATFCLGERRRHCAELLDPHRLSQMERLRSRSAASVSAWWQPLRAQPHGAPMRRPQRARPPEALAPSSPPICCCCCRRAAAGGAGAAAGRAWRCRHPTMLRGSLTGEPKASRRCRRVLRRWVRRRSARAMARPALGRRSWRLWVGRHPGCWQRHGRIKGRACAQITGGEDAGADIASGHAIAAAAAHAGAKAAAVGAALPPGRRSAASCAAGARP